MMEKNSNERFMKRNYKRFIKRDDVYEVKKILEKRGRGNNVQYFVKWLGYPAKFNSWISASDIKMI